MRLVSKLVIALVVVASVVLAFPACAGAGRHIGPGPPDVRVLPHLSPAEMAWSLSWRRADVRWRAADDRLRACFGLRPLPQVARAPRILAFPSVWRETTLRWRAEARSRLQDCKRLLHRLSHPPRPYTARSWWPLALHVGWPAWTKAVWLRVVTRESHGSPRSVNHTSGATGLMQICPGGRRYLDAEYNLRAGLGKYKASGWAPWAATAY
jgi:hypothetical protein